MENKDELPTINCTREERITGEMYFLDRRRGTGTGRMKVVSGSRKVGHAIIQRNRAAGVM